MELILERRYFHSRCTIGWLSDSGDFICYTLEDKVRPDQVKISGETAIPTGRYTIIMDYSERFKKIMPHILDVPGFDGIRIHAGNTDKDTHGCILLGKTYLENTDRIAESQLAVENFIRHFLQPALDREEKVTIEIQGEYHEG